MRSQWVLGRGRWAWAVVGLCTAVPALAEGLSISGFATLAAGRTFGGCTSSAMATEYAGGCTRYIADWAHAGVYDESWSLQPESRAGIQATWRAAPQLSLTAQLTTRALPEQHANVEWLYASWQPSPAWTLQVGRKRLPLYYYSDFQDIGYAYNTVRPSPDVYGWDVVNYNGASLAYSAAIGDWTLRTELLGGSENSKKNHYARLVVDERKDLRWNQIVGAVFEANYDWFSARVSYVRSGFRQVDRASGAVDIDSGSQRQSFFGLSLNADVGAWTLRSELGNSKRDFLGYSADFALLTAGYRVGDLTFTGGTSFYREKASDAAYIPLKISSLLAAVRYDVHKGGALKLQLDHVRDKGTQAFTGNARALTVSYDLTF